MNSFDNKYQLYFGEVTPVDFFPEPPVEKSINKNNLALILFIAASGLLLVALIRQKEIKNNLGSDANDCKN